MKKLCLLVVAVLCTPLVPTAAAQVPPDADLNVQLFLRSVYPDLFQRSVTFLWSAAGMKRQVSVIDGSIDPLKGTAAMRLLDAEFELDSTHAVRGFSARGIYLNGEANRRLALALKTAGGFDAAVAEIGRIPEFGPERQPSPPKQIALSIASRQDLRVMSFSQVTRVDEEHGFLWSVIAESGSTGKAYLLMFEPFNGRLVSMVER